MNTRSPSRRQPAPGSPAAPLLALTLAWPLVLPAGPATAEQQPSLVSLLADASRDNRYLPPTRAELDSAESLFVKTLQASAPSRSLQEEWNRSGWEMLVRNHDDKQILVLREPAHQRHGRGFFAFRLNADWPVALQAPHSFHDTHTRRIALRLFEEGPFAAVAWNTVPRSALDTAHSSGNYFEPLTRAMIRVHPRGAILQLHGFAAEKRTRPAALNSQLIVSNGTRFPGPLARDIISRFRSQLTPAVSLFPLEVDELGGTTNRQAETTHEMGLDRFLHLEMNLEIRKDLRHRKERRRDFIESLSETFPFS